MLFDHNGEEQFTEACRIAKPWEITHDSVFFKQLSLSCSQLVSGDFLTFAGWPWLWLINPLSCILNANHCDIWALFLLYEVGISRFLFYSFQVFWLLFVACPFPSAGQCFSFLSLEAEQKWQVVRLRPQFFDGSFWRTTTCRKRDVRM